MPRLLCLLPIAAAVWLTIYPCTTPAQHADPVRVESGLRSGIPSSDASFSFSLLPFPAQGSLSGIPGSDPTEPLPGARGQPSVSIKYYDLVPGFLPEKKNAMGFAVGTGFARPNPWG